MGRPLADTKKPVARTVAEELGIEWDVEHRVRFHGEWISPSEFLRRNVAWKRSKLRTEKQ